MPVMMEISKLDNEKFVFKKWLSIRQIYVSVEIRWRIADFVAYFKILESSFCNSLPSLFKFFMLRQDDLNSVKTF